MNLLFLLPDYFFRNTYYEYMWIVDAIIDGIGDKDFNRFGCQAKIYCGNELKILIVERRRDIENYFVEIPSLGLFNQRKAFPPSNWSLSDSEKIWSWIADFQLKSFFANRQSLLLKLIYEKYAFTHILHWGNNIPLASWCEERDIKYYFLEMGFMRNPSVESLVIDSCGVNSLSSIAKSEEKDFALKFDFNIQILQESVYEAHNKDYSAHVHSKSCFDSPNVFESYNGLRLNKSSNTRSNLNPNAKKFGIFLQLADDTQIVGGSGFRSMYEYLSYIIPKIRDFHGDDSEIFIRFHPGSSKSSSRPVNVLDAHKCRQLIKNFPTICELDINQSWCEQVSYFNSLYTINSSIAFEAWLFSPSLDIVVSGIPGWYPSSDLYKSFVSPDKKIEKFCYMLNMQILKGVALYSLGGYLYRWSKCGNSLINCILHRILCESFALPSPNLRFSVPGPGTSEVLARAPISSYTQISYLFNQNFCPVPITYDKLSILEFLSKQSLKFFNDVYYWSDISQFPYTITYSVIRQSLVLKKNSRIHVNNNDFKFITLFVATSNFRVIRKILITTSMLSSGITEIKLSTRKLDLCESRNFYIYLFLNPLYNLSSDSGSFKCSVDAV